MKQITYLLVLFIAIAVTFSSCGKKEGLIPEPKKNYISKITEDSEVIAEFYYDEKYRVDSIVMFGKEEGTAATEPAIQNYVFLTYDAGDRNTHIRYFNKERTNIDVFIEIKYNADKLLYEMLFKKNQTWKDSSLTYEYNSSKQVIKHFRYHFENSISKNFLEYHSYLYNSKNNVTIEDIFTKVPNETKAEITYRNEYEHDEYTNPFENITFLYNITAKSSKGIIHQLSSLSHNNITKFVKKTAQGETLTGYTSKFTYNEDGYPVQEERLYFDRFDPVIIEYEYITKEGSTSSGGENNNSQKE